MQLLCTAVASMTTRTAEWILGRPWCRRKSYVSLNFWCVRYQSCHSEFALVIHWVWPCFGMPTLWRTHHQDQPTVMQRKHRPTFRLAMPIHLQPRGVAVAAPRGVAAPRAVAALFITWGRLFLISRHQRLLLDNWQHYKSRSDHISWSVKTESIPHLIGFKGSETFEFAFFLRQ